MFLCKDFVLSTNPWDYMMQSGLADQTQRVDSNQLTELHESIDSMDEYHLAFALVVAERENPTLFALKAAKLLVHESMSVRINAYNVLRSVPHSDLSSEIVANVETSLQRCPEADRFRDVLHR